MNKLAITCGDPAGVGPEIIAQWLQANPAEARGTVLIGPLNWLEEACGDLPVEMEVVGPFDFQRQPGRPSLAGSRVALAALELAAQGCRESRWQGVVTAPISKKWMREAGFPYPGHTEFFADRWSGRPSMAFVSAHFKVVLATWHDPFQTVPMLLRDGQLLERAVERAAFLARAHGLEQPRLAVCGLNPHAGEEGLLGTEEREFLDPLLDRLRERHPGLSRCLPPDTVFWRARQGEFDAVVALYHDQGLIPLKTLDFDEAVNVTLGLAWIRTSPDHGTAFDLAGRGRASPRSFAAAVATARRLMEHKRTSQSG